MSEDFYRINSADEDKKLAATKVGDLYYLHFITQTGAEVAAISAEEVRYEQVSNVLAYAGNASPGTSTSTAGWQLKQLTFDAAGSVYVNFAEGSAAFDKIWDNRTSYTY